MNTEPTIIDKKAPLTPPPLPARKRHGLYWWCSLLLAILLAIPLLLYIAAMSYVSFGYVKERIVRTLTKNFETDVRVGDVRTQWLNNLLVESITVGSGDAAPLKVEAVKVDFDPMPLLQDNRIKLVSVQQPRIDLRRSPDGKWNLVLKPSEKKEGGYRIEQVQFSEGCLDLQWGGGAGESQRVRLQALRGTLTDNGKESPNLFSFSGIFDSLEEVTVNGSAGPGAAWSFGAFGGVNLERDLGSVLRKYSAGRDEAGIRGLVRFELGGRRESLLMNAARGGPVNVNGRLNLARLQWPFSSNWSIQMPSRTLDFIGRIDVENSEALAVVEDLQLRLDGVASLRGPGKVLEKPALYLRFDELSGKVDLSALNEIFSPRLLPDSIRLKGSLDVSRFTGQLGLANGAPPQQFAAALSANGVRATLQTLGELPAIDFAGELAWPALNGATLSIGELGRMNVSIRDVKPSDPNFLLTLAAGTKLHDFRIDVGRFWESDVGRRILTGTFDPKKAIPAVSEMPFIFRGFLSGQDVTLGIAPNVAQAEQLSIRGLKLEDYSIAKWPLPVKVPEKKFAGAMDLAASMKQNVVESVTVSANLVEPAVKGKTAARVDFEHTYYPVAAPEKRIGPVKIRQLLLPLETFDDFFDIKRNFGVSGTGLIAFKDGAFDILSQSGTSIVSLDNSTLLLPVPPALQNAAVSALRASGNNVLASTLETFPINTVKLANVNAAFEASIAGRRIKLKGTIEALPIKIKMPQNVPLVSLFGDSDYTAYTLPAADVEIEADVGTAPGTSTYKLKLAWQKSNKLELLAREVASITPNPADTTWHFTGRFENPGINLGFAIPLDENKRTVGPIKLTVTEMDLSTLPQKFLPAAVQHLSGRAKNLEAVVNAVSYANPKLKDVAARIEGVLAGVNLRAAESEVLLDGTAVVVLPGGGEGLAFTTLLKMKSCDALLGNGALYIPRTPADLKFVGKWSEKDGISRLAIHTCEMTLGSELQISTGGSVVLAGTVPTEVNLEGLRIYLPDMARAVQKYGPDNLKNRDFWFGSINLAGAGGFDGKVYWDAKGKSEVSGKLGLDKATFALGDAGNYKLVNASGEIPLMLRFDAKAEPAAASPQPELRGKMTVGSLVSPVATAAQQELAFVAKTNQIKVENAIALSTELGTVSVGSVVVNDFFSPLKLPEVAFQLSTSLNLDKMLKAGGLGINGMESCVLNGAPFNCRLRKTPPSDVRGPWALDLDGSLRGPFFGGEIIAQNLSARGLFGPAPAFGADLAVRGTEGIRIKAFTDANQQLGETITGLPGKKLGKVSLRANLAVNGFEAISAGIAGIQKFDLEVESLDFKDNEFWFDGEFAMTMNAPLVRAAFPSILFGDEKIKQLTFGVRNLAFKYILRDGWLRGPIATKLPNDLIMQGYGSDSAVGALLEKRLKQDIKADPDYRLSWPGIVKQLKK
ncbi:MAG TPA: hypothetical protein VEK08_02065 [Planctomycetota bacterium]|nr:hypothetical protein [Planctomycetota bacterium]